MKNARIVALVVCVLCAGCVSSVTTSEVDREYQARYSYGERVGLYWVDRLQDTFLDTAQVNLTFGPSWPVVNVRATKFAQLGWGSFKGIAVGMRERALGKWYETSLEYGVGPFYWTEIDRETSFGLPAAFDHDYEYTGWDLLEPEPEWKEDGAHWGDFGVKVHCMFGVQVNVSTVEFADAVISWVFTPISFPMVLMGYDQPWWDIMGDDTYYLVRDELESEGLGED